MQPRIKAFTAYRWQALEALHLVNTKCSRRPYGAVCWSALCDRGIPDNTHLLFFFSIFVI